MTRLRVFVSRLLDAVIGTRRDRELDAELQLHLDLLAEDLVASGMPPDAARFEARRRFGGVDQVKARYRERRGIPALEWLLQDVRFAWRSLHGARRFSLTAVIVLALGIGVNNMMFTIFNGHTLRGLPLRAADRVLIITTSDARTAGDRGLSWPEFDEVRRSVTAASVAAFVTSPSSLAEPGIAPERVDRTHVTADTLAVLEIRPMLGRDFRGDDDVPGAAPTVLLSERIWRSRYAADPAIVGRVVLVDGIPTTVIGVLQTQSGFPQMTGMLQPIGQMRDLDREARSARTLRVVARVPDAGDVNAARAQIETAGVRIAAAHPESNADVRLHVVRINERYFGNFRDPSWLSFMAVGCLVALISCANVANLLIGRAIDRSREIALRMALGAGRWRIVRQLLVESAMLAVAGGGLGLVIGIGGVGFFQSQVPPNMLPYWWEYRVDVRVLGALVAMTAVAVLVIGIAPALQTSRADPITVLRQGGAASEPRRRAARWTNGFLVVELGLAVLMLANIVLAWRYNDRTLPSDAALYVDDVLTASVTLPAERYPDAAARRAFLEAVRSRLESAAGVEALAFASVLPVRYTPEQHLRVRDAADREPLPVRSVLISRGYFDVLRLPLLDGRPWPERHLAEEPATAVVNEHLVTQLGDGTSAMGVTVGLSADAAGAPPAWMTVIGVAPTIRQQPVTPEPIVYRSIDAEPPSTVVIMARVAVGIGPAATLLRETIRRIDGHLPLYNLATLRGATEEIEWAGRVSNRVATILTTLALLLAGVGLYAVTARSVTSRRREIGIRLAIGASPLQVPRQILAQAGTRVALGTLIGIGCLAAWEAAFLPAVRTGTAYPAARLADPVVVAAIAAALVAVSVTACLAPLRRARLVSPALTLKDD